jgi:hypothetical protein
MTMTIEGVEYLPAAAAAEQLATTETKVLMLLKKKALEGELIEGTWFVTTASLSSYVPSCEPAAEMQCRTSCSSSGCGCH